ncbi:hypothetical protein [Pseudobdellovibrio sp. HCB154]|uniref:hypothetical protein n=1 Tax=Pseudobdellovibrio sp. HCB154 TaxID=3386277 RepID=UPI0039173F6D
MTVSKQITLIALLAVAISSCSPKGSSGPAPASEASRDFSSASFAVSTPGSDIPSDYANCTFNGQTVAHGSSVNAYQNSTVAYGTYCSAERRTCDNGVLSGSFQYATCSVAAPASCLFNGQTVAHGSSVQAYPNSTVSYNQTCQAETRTCSNGVLSGSAAYASCSVNTAASCLFNGQTVAHGSNVQAFANSTVAYGQTCSVETRTCTDGILSGSNAYASCNVEAAASCLFNGQTVAHGQAVTAFQNSTQAYGTQCVSEQRVCSNGVMSGSYQYGSCNVDAAKSCLFNGQTVAHGQSVQAFPTSSVDFGSNCISDTRTCNDGVLSGSNQYATCSVNKPASCLFNGQTIAHNQVVNAFATSTVAFGGTCSSEERLCYNGVLDGSNQYASCTVDAPASCLINGLTIAHGQSTILFKDAKVPQGETCVQESRTCNNGSLSGSYTNGSCEVEAPKSCEFNGRTVADGQTVTAFLTGSVAYGQSCQSETRTCSNGVLSGSNTFASCSVEAALSCTFNGSTIAHGQTVEAYKSSSVAYGQSCSSETRTCTNGVLSGSNTYSSCSVEAAKSCSFNGQTILSGSSVKAYASSQVPYGQTCSSENRVCTNGVLSGSNTYSSCVVGPKPPVVTPPKSCTFNGKTVAHGSSVQAYKSSSVGYGQSCQGETRTCNDGILSGSYTSSSCAVEGPKSCKILFGLITIPHGFTIWAAAHTTAGGGNRCEAEITLCNNGKFVIDPSLTCQHGNQPPVTVPPPKPGEEQCEIDVKSNNGKHLGVNHDGKHVDSGLHLGWYKDKKPCKPKDPKPPVPPKPDPHHPCEHKDKHRNNKEKDDCDKKKKKNKK